MKLRLLVQRIKKEYEERKGARFFSERALLSALLEKNGMNRNQPLISPDSHVPDGVCASVISDLSRLLEGYPIQYYLGTEFFCGEEFFVAPGVLIPRPETELLVTLAAERLEEGSVVFDFCCGSGCIGIALLQKREDIRCYSFDLSDQALALTEKNRARFALEDRLFVERLDVLSPLARERILALSPALVISNPPYLTESEMKEIDANVAREPSMALFGGKDGLLFYRHFLSLSKETNTPFLCEIGAKQEKDLRELIEEEGLKGEFFKDFSHLPRAFFVR
jgi:release factor glutamine methyltransferase